jgi:hypothetical protein
MTPFSIIACLVNAFVAGFHYPFLIPCLITATIFVDQICIALTKSKEAK